MPGKQLFRKEVLTQNEGRLFGGVIVANPLPFRFLAFGVLLLLAVVIGFLIYGRYARKVTVSGYLVPTKGLVRIYAPKDGIIIRKTIQVGDNVDKGQVLFVISTPQSSLHTPDVNAALIDAARDTRETLLAQIDIAKKLKSRQIEQARQQVSGLKVQADKLAAQIASERASLKIAQHNLARFKTLKASHLVAASDYDVANQKVLTETTQLGALEKSAAALKSQIGATPGDIALIGLKAKNQIADYRQQINKLDQRITQLGAQQNVVIHAPRSGIVSTTLARVGQTAQPNVPLATIVPAGSHLEARLLVPTKAIGFVKSGERVKLRYSAFPYQHFGLYQGEVTQVSDSVLTPNELPAPLPLKTAVYPVTVVLNSQSVEAYGQQRKLHAGMALSADVILDHRRLIQWILEPLYSVQGRI